MAGYPLVGTLAKVASISGTSDLEQLLLTALKVNEITINEDSEDFDVTELDASTDTFGMERIQGLSSGTFDFVGHYPKTNPRIGNGGLVTYASGYAEFVNAWTLRAEFGEIDITSFDGSTIPTARSYMPNGVFDWSGTYSAVAVSGTAAGQPSAPSAAPASATFKIAEDGTDPALVGTILTKSVRQGIRKADKIGLEYAWVGSGKLQEVKGTSLPGLRVGATAYWDIPDWDEDGDGVADVSVVINTSASRTITAKAFLRSLEISCEVGQPIRVSGTVRYCGSIARA